MNALAESVSSQQSHALRALATAGLIAGILDICSAFVVAGLRGATPTRVLQFVASGLIGPQSFAGGPGTAALGLALHFVIAFGAATVFYLASRKLGFLVRHAIVSGLAYGVAVHAFMNLVVLPLSAARPRHSVSAHVTQLLIHMLLIGLPISLIVRRFSSPEPSIHHQ